MTTEEQRYWLERDFITDLLSQLPSHIFWKNKDCVYLGCNEAFAKSLGLRSPQDIIGKTDYDLPTTEEESDRYRVDDLQVMRSRQSKLNIEESQTLPDGRKIILLTSKVPLLNKKNEVVGVLGIYSDITDRKNMELQLQAAKEKAEAANQAKSIFIANMSHDIRTPLAGVIGISDLLEQEGETSKDRELAHTIHISAERLLQLLDDILEVISADEHHENSLNLNTFNLLARLAFIKELMISSTQQHHVELIFNIDGNIPKYVVGDRVKFDRILLNLISNALKFTPSGTISVFVKVLQRSEQEATLEFQVIDTGIGIPYDQLDKIFERFYRLDPSSRNKYKGHGIGLFIVRKYVELFNGEITVESELGKGSAFTIILPIKIGNECNIQEDIPEISRFVENAELLKRAGVSIPALPVQSFKSQGESLRVLVIEDDAIARRVAKPLLTKAGFAVDDVEDAEQGFWRVMKNDYDLILTDIGLPGMAGDELVVAIRAWETGMHRSATPIVGLTAHAKHQASLQQTGINMLVTKPLDQFKLQEITDYFFGKKENSVATSSRMEYSELGHDLPETEEALFKLDMYPLLDEKEGIEATGGNIEFYKELTMLIDQTFPEELPLLIEAHNEGDWERVQSIAHKLKGGAMYCGAKRLRYACQYTEQYRLAGHSKLLEPLYSQLLAVVKDTIDFLKKWLMQKSA